MKGFLSILVLTSLLVYAAYAAQKQKSGYTPCKTQKDCVQTKEKKCPKYFFVDLGNCYGGLCKCYNSDGEGVAPNNCSEVTKGNCYNECKRTSTDYVKDDNAYKCGDLCFCKFRLNNVNRCSKDSDCGINCDAIKDEDDKKECKKNAKPGVEKDTRCTGLSKCNLLKKACFCYGLTNATVGDLSSTQCKDERYCEGLCSAQPFSTGTVNKGKICTRTVKGVTYNDCFCPTKGF